jgi:hypothetical protein
MKKKVDHTSFMASCHHIVVALVGEAPLRTEGSISRRLKSDFFSSSNRSRVASVGERPTTTTERRGLVFRILEVKDRFSTTNKCGFPESVCFTIQMLGFYLQIIRLQASHQE